MKRLLLWCFCALTLSGYGQPLQYQILFEGIGDNREFTAPLAYPQTIMGTRAAFELGIDIENHRLRGGLSHLFEFGSDLDAHKPKLTLYYQYTETNKEFIFGSFPRRGKINFPLAMLTDTLLYYRPNIEGLYGRVNWNWGHQIGFVDWVGRQTETQREQFMAGFSGEINKGRFFFQDYFLLFHDAHTLNHPSTQHIRDYLGWALQGGWRTTQGTPLLAEAKAGLLSSMFRERNVSDGFITKHSFIAEVNGRYKKVGIKSVLNTGAAHNFKYGDSYYRAKDYWRTDLIWYFITHKNVSARFNISMHLVNWDYVDNQQQLSVVYLLGR